VKPETCKYNNCIRLLGCSWQNASIKPGFLSKQPVQANWTTSSMQLRCLMHSAVTLSFCLYQHDEYHASSVSLSWLPTDKSCNSSHTRLAAAWICCRACQFYTAFLTCGPHKHQICSKTMVQNCLKPTTYLVPQRSGHLLLATRWSR